MKKMYSVLSLVCLVQLIVVLEGNAQSSRTYHTNKAISGQTEETQGVNYLLLHKAYAGTLMTDHYLMGKISAIRGAVCCWNRKWTVEVNTASAYNTDRGSIITYNEPASLVKLTYNGERYLAVSINNTSSLNSFSFTGYAQGESLLLVYDDNVSDVEAFTNYDPVTIQGNVGIGIPGTAARLHVTAPQGATLAKFTQSDIVHTDAYLSVDNSTTVTGHFIPALRGRSKAPGRPFGISLVGEADDIVPPGDELYGGAVIIDGRSKNGTPLVNNNVLMVNSYGKNLVAVKANGSMGIGVTDTKGYKLAVAGSMIAEKVKVKLQGNWPDYVFAEGYELLPIHELASYVQSNQHLPDVPSAKEVEKEGLDVGEMNKQLLKKIEELTLYVIQLKQESEAQQQMINELKQIIKK
ncbi:hypothetical protein [Chitinophaga japonensis]|uniref:Peptidase S74 domain-containing protein n=1 Tax=Chitinophaga japonensis TaxID=104662 RepID=A0A562T081_CHIJA|nr:hypothetical protein [Chitinophaga japonensis]TWI86763.1 hypothetical protein LX66_4027 [Chitinophaga japonensis]